LEEDFSTFIEGPVRKTGPFFARPPGSQGSWRSLSHCTAWNKKGCCRRFRVSQGAQYCGCTHRVSPSLFSLLQIREKHSSKKRGFYCQQELRFQPYL